MKSILKITLLGLISLLLTQTVLAQSYSIDWYKVAGGGGVSTGGTYTVNGTIGQADAGGPMTGGGFSLTGGFWSMISLVQTTGAPKLYISRSGGTISVYWQNTGSWTLQQNGNLAVPSWANSGYSITTITGTNYVSFPIPSGNMFFRLKQ